VKKKTKASNRGLMLFEDVYWRALKIHAAEKGTTVSAIVPTRR
jgi:multisubunit Na+/H+ antiporter MnhG subunit